MKRTPLLGACLALLPALALAAEPTPEPDSTVVVTARRDDTAPLGVTPLHILSGQELVRRRMGTLGETLAGLPGVHLDNFGAGAARPVIRGQTLPRIEVLSDGATLFDVSSVSPDHGIATDPLLLDAIEVQRGPAAVRYGGNAIGGAINLIDSKVPKRIPEGGVSGATEVRYGTGDNEKTVVGRLTAGSGNVAVHAEGARRNAGEYEVPSAFGADRLRDSFADSESRCRPDSSSTTSSRRTSWRCWRRGPMATTCSTRPWPTAFRIASGVGPRSTSAAPI